MTPVELSRTVLRAVRRAVDEGQLGVVVPGRAVVTAPGPGGCGDYATNIALQLARPAGQPPERVAEVLRPYLLGAAGVSDVVVTGPGFLNISLHRGEASAALVREILRSGVRYGHAGRPTGQLVQLHAPHEVRAVVVMDAVARVLRSQGALVRTSCVARPEPEWTEVLGAKVDAYGTPESPAPLDVNVRPVPAAPAGPFDGRPGSSALLEVDARPAPASPGRDVDLDPVSLGRDAGRWALLHPAAHDRPRVTGEYLSQREGNPLFRVRYAHARARALSRNAADLGFDAHPGDVIQEPQDVSDLQVQAQVQAPVRIEVRELEVALADHPRILAAAAAQHAPDRLARHLVVVADAVIPLFSAVLPRGEEKPLAAHRARLALAEAAGVVLAGGLSLLGIDAPDHL
ncbi:ArgS-related anticodon-binding protein NrtL [Streptomyces sp. NPDC060000]|uniref:ArgS-related anticodon-binding protein NrtL n=1 Tax=Streptomyces sp. NPDC060000 TaxID=3347031 RepID=UPI0036B321EA